MKDKKSSYALLSVHDKTGIVELARALESYGVGIIATGGTALALQEAGLHVAQVEEITGFPEMMDGRVKTLHPKIHGGLLARRDKAEHRDQMERHGIPSIDFVIVRFYPFEKTVASGASASECIEQIDIGAPAMVRGAAKNHDFVTVITEGEDYPHLLSELKKGGGKTSQSFRRAMAERAFAQTARYDAGIAEWFAHSEKKDGKKGQKKEAMGTSFSLRGRRRLALRYGENPHQKAALYSFGHGGLAEAKQIQGKALSYNNIADADAAWALVSEFENPASVIIKHANPCGAGEAKTLLSSYEAALASDSVSAFGGIVACNRALDGETAQKMAEIFTELIIAPQFTKDARELFKKKQSLRLLEIAPTEGEKARGDAAPKIHRVSGGFLVQEEDAFQLDMEKTKCMTKRKPSQKEREEMAFAWRVCKHVKSNAILLAKSTPKSLASVGVGAGQMSRVDSARIAIEKAGARAQGSVAASDAFFPFADGLEILAKAGVRAVIQPGGSKRDEEVIKAANAHKIAMLFTNTRHFLH